MILKGISVAKSVFREYVKAVNKQQLLVVCRFETEVVMPKVSTQDVPLGSKPKQICFSICGGVE